MLYEQYEKKVLAIARFRAKLTRYRLLLIMIASLLCLSLASFLFCKGILVSDIMVAGNAVYGEEYSFDAKVFLGEASYEYSYDGGQTWTSEKPTEAGEYRVRAIETRIFGARSRGRERGFTIEPRTLTVEIEDYKAEYNGKEHFVDSCEISANTLYNLLEGHSITQVVTSKRVVAPCEESLNEIISVIICDENGNDVTKNYQFDYKTAKFEITKRQITVESDSESKTYDGTPLTCESYNESEVKDLLAPGDYIESATFGSSITSFNEIESGEVENKIEIVIKNEQGEIVTNYYDIIYNYGKLSLEKRQITVKAGDDTKVYDGTPLTCNQITVSGLVDGHSYNNVQMTEQSVITLAGSMENKVKSLDIYSGETNVTKNYQITYESGTLTVDKKAITITSDSAEKAYDGTPLTCENIVGEVDLANGDKLTFSNWGEIIYYGENGSADNTFDYTITNENNEDVTSSYNVTKNCGKLTINKKEITITSDSAEKAYDGIPLTCKSYNESEVKDLLAQGDTLTLTYTGSITSFNQEQSGKTDNTFNYKITNANGEEVTSSYEVTQNFGELTLSQREIQVYAKSAERTYNGNAFTYPEIALTSESLTLISGHTFKNVQMTEQSQITEVGEKDNVLKSFEIHDLNGNNVTKNYTFNIEEAGKGNLEVIPCEIALLASSAEKVYDGTPLTSNQITLTTGRLVEGHEICNVQMTEQSQITEVGEKDNVLKSFEIHDSKGKNVTENYSFKIEDAVKGSLTVTKQEITITSDSANKIYDGTPLTCESYNESEVEKLLAQGDTLTLTYTGSITDYKATGEDNGFTFTLVNSLGEDASNNYEITTKFGKLTIEKRQIKVKADDATKVYDGEEFTSNSVTDISDGENCGLLLALGHEICNVQMNASCRLTVVNSVDNIIRSLEIHNSNGDNVTNNYDITKQKGTLTVTKRPIVITISTTNATKVYDGTCEWEGGEFTYSTNSEYQLVSGHSISIKTQLTALNAGECECEITSYAFNNLNIANNYQVTCENIDFEILKREIIIVPSYADKSYDGEEFTSDKCETKAGTTTLVRGHYIICPTTAKLTEVGTVENSVCADYNEKAKIYDANGNLVGDNYNIIGIGRNESGSEEQRNISILAIKAYEILFISESAVFTYDGNEHYCHEYKMAVGYSLPEGLKIEAVFDSGAKVKDFGNYNGNNKFTVQILNADNSVNNNYFIRYSYGTISIEKRTVVIKPENAQKVYDGIALRSNVVIDISEGENSGLLSGHEIRNVKMTSLSAITSVGTRSNLIEELSIFNGEIDITNNYNLIFDSTATLTVTQRAITITANAQKVYDGNADTSSYTISSTIEIVSGSLVAGHNITSITSHANIQTIYASENILTACVIKSGGVILTSNYCITFEIGVAVITKRPIKVEVTDAEKIYDGTPLVHNKVVDSSSGVNSGLVDGHTFADIQTSGSITNYGEVENKLDYFVIVDQNGVDISENYQAERISGKLIIIRRTIIIIAGSAEKTYDGEALESDHYEVDNIVEGHYFESGVQTNGEQTNAGESENDILLDYSGMVIKDAYGNLIIIENYIIVVEKGTLKVNKRKVTVTANSSTKVYDGNPLTCENAEYRLTGDEYGNAIIIDHVVIIDMTSSSTITNVGTNVNIVSSITVTVGGVDVTENYEFSHENGLLEVTKRDVIVDVLDAEKVYDGTPLTSNNCVIATSSPNDLISGHTFNCSTSGSITTCGEEENSISYFRVKDENGESVTSNYNLLSSNSGNLKVTKRPIVVYANAEKVYDGTVTLNNYATLYIHSDSEYDLVDGHTTTLRAYANEESINATTCTITSVEIYNGYANVSDNYDIEYRLGSATILKRDIIIQIDDAEKLYDGTPLTNSLSYRIAESSPYQLPLGQRLWCFTSGKVTECGEIGYSVLTSYSIIKNGEINATDNYNLVDVINGKLTVNPRPITIIANSNSKVYDGTPLKDENYKIGGYGLVSSHTVSGVTVSGSITNYSIAGVDNIADITNAKIFSGSKDVSHNYEITATNGKLTIEKRKITVSLYEYSKVYNGEVSQLPTIDEWWISSTNKLVSGHNLSLSNIILQNSFGQVVSNALNAGEYTTTASATIETDGEIDVTYNYDITISGRVVIEKRIITFTAFNFVDEMGENCLFSDLSIVVGSLLQTHQFHVDEDLELTPEEWVNHIEVVDNTVGELRTGNYSFVYLPKGEITQENG